MNSLNIVRAIDIGYGNTKFTVSDGHTHGEPIQCRMFPSVTPVAKETGLDGYGERKRTVVVEVGARKYEVGPDAMDSMPTNGSRSLDLDFSSKDTYQALAYGALHFMEVDAIDLLVVGLPVSTVSANAKNVSSTLTGVHRIAGRTVEVKSVLVLPQPLGGLFDFAERNDQVRSLTKGNTLLIDPGYFTLDWVVMHGNRMNWNRSGAANNAGMAAILRAVADALVARVRTRDSKPSDISESVLSRIDQHIRTGEEFRFNGKVEDLTKCLDAGKSVMSEGINKMLASVGSLADIDRVIIVGGAAPIYQEPISKTCSSHDVVVVADPVFSNVRGFQIKGNIEAAKALAAA